MALFSIDNNQLSFVKEVPYKLEKELQTIFEKNISNILDLDLVKSELSIKNKRIDTLAFDSVKSASVIIEYKRDKNVSVIDQGFAYLSLMLENKADFIVEFNESLSKNLKRDDIDWSQTRVIFVSSAFTENQKLATNFKDLAIELCEVKRFENNTLLINILKKSNAAESIKIATSKNEALTKITSEIKQYSEDDLLQNGNDFIKELYQKYKEAILNLSDNFEIVPLKFYIAFKVKSNIVDFEIYRNSIKLTLNAKLGKIDDPKNILKDVSTTGHRGNGDYQVSVTDTENLEYLMSVIKQVIKINS
jgi:predicted transport protein